jgi:hypothetical protein
MGVQSNVLLGSRKGTLIECGEQPSHNETRLPYYDALILLYAATSAIAAVPART